MAEIPCSVKRQQMSLPLQAAYFKDYRRGEAKGAQPAILSGV
jgi:hypothetical protein